MIDVLEYLKKKSFNGNLIFEEGTEATSSTEPSAPDVADTAAKPDETDKKDAPDGTVVSIYDNTIDEIVVVLHKKAIEETKLDGMTLVNSAFNDPKNPTKLVSTGEHIISVTSADKKTPIEQKVAIEAIKSYVQWFIGPDASKKITDKTVYPLVDESTAKVDKDEAPKENTSYNGNLKNILTEGEPESKPGKGDEKPDQFGQDEDDPEDKKELDKNNTSDKVNDALTSSNGYFTVYTLRAFPGKKDTSIKDAAKKLGTDILRGIRGYNWWTGSTGSSLGELYDELDDIFGKIDAKQLKTDVSTQLDKAIPGHRFDAVEVYDKKSILNWLSKKLDKKDKLKIQGADHALCIKIGDDSGESGKEANIRQARNKMIKRNLSIISDVVNKSLGNLLKTIKYKIKPEHIIITKDEGTEREKVDKANLVKQIKDGFKNIKDKKGFENEYGKETIDFANVPEKVEDLDDLEVTLKRIKKFIEKNNLEKNKKEKTKTESITNYFNLPLITEGEADSNNQNSTAETEAGSSGADGIKKIDLNQVKTKVEEQAKKVFSEKDLYSTGVTSSKETLDLLSKEYESNEKLDQTKFDSAATIEIKDLTEENAKALTLEKVNPIFDDTFKELNIKNFGDVIEVQKELQKKGDEKLNSSQINSFDGIFNMLFEGKDEKSEEISKEDLEKIEKDFENIAKSKLPKHDVESKVAESSLVIEELKKNSVGNNDLYGKLKDAKYIFSICAKAKNTLKESFTSFAFDILDLILEGGKTKSAKEVFIGKVAHAINLNKDLLDKNKDKIEKLDIDQTIKKYLLGDYSKDIKDGKLDKGTQYFSQMHNDKAFKNATSKLDEIINSSDEKKAEDAETEKKKEEKKAEEKTAKEEQKPELTKFKDKLEQILKRNPKFFEKYQDEIQKSDFNNKIKTYLKDNIKNDYDGQHLKSSAFLKKNISDEELKTSLGQLTKFYEEYSNSDEGKKEKEEIDNSKEDAKFSLTNNLDEKIIKEIFDEILSKYPGNIKTDSQDFYIVNSEVDEKKDITKINAEWSTTHKHDQQKENTSDNGSIQKDSKEKVKTESFKIKLVSLLCEDLIDDLVILEAGSEFHKGQLSKDKVGYKTKIEAGLKRIDEVIPKDKFSKILDAALRQYKDQFSRNYEKHVKSGNLKATLLNPSKFTDHMYNDFTRGELFAITVILRVILYSYFFTEIGSYALMPANLVSEEKEPKKEDVKIYQKAFIKPFNSILESATDAQKTKKEPEKGEDKVQDRKQKFDFFIIPMKGLKYKDKKEG